MKLSEINEFDLIQKIKNNFSYDMSSQFQGIGDDCAIFPKNEKELSIINHGKWTYNPETKDLIIVYLENNNWLRYLGDELFEGKIIKLDESDLELKIRKSFYGREETNYFKRF